MRFHHSLRAARAGFSIVEVLVALVLLTVGLLAIAGGESLAVRMSVAASRERRAAQRAADRLALLTSQGCAVAQSGALVDPDSGFSERWSVAAPVNGATLLDAQVSWSAQRGVRSMVLRGALLC